jgi:hypothetical protein
VLWAGDAGETRAARGLYQAVEEAGVPVRAAVPGQAVDLGDGAWLRVVVSGDEGSVFSLEWERFRALLVYGTPGIPIDRTAAVLLLPGGFVEGKSEDGEADTVELTRQIAALRPRLILADSQIGGSAGKDLLNGFTVLDPESNGWINVSTDGEQMWVEADVSG